MTSQKKPKLPGVVLRSWEVGVLHPREGSSLTFAIGRMVYNAEGEDLNAAELYELLYAQLARYVKRKNTH